MRKWHRWISLPALIFLLVMSVSGLVLQVQGLLNEDEEKFENQKSNTLLGSPVDYSAKLALAQKIVFSKIGNIPIKKIEVEFRQTPPLISLYTDEAQSRLFQIDLETSQIVTEKRDDTDRFWIKLHSGELFGEAGRSTGIFSGLVLLFLLISGFWIYLRMYQLRPKTGPWWKRVFW